MLAIETYLINVNNRNLLTAPLIAQILALKKWLQYRVLQNHSSHKLATLAKVFLTEDLLSTRPPVQLPGGHQLFVKSRLGKKKNTESLAPIKEWFCDSLCTIQVKYKEKLN